MLNVGFDSYVAENQIIAIVSYGGAKLKAEVSRRKKEEGTGKSLLQDCTKNRVIKSVVVCSDGTYVLSSVNSSTLAARLNSGTANKSKN